MTANDVLAIFAAHGTPMTTDEVWLAASYREVTEGRLVKATFADLVRTLWELENQHRLECFAGSVTLDIQGWVWWVPA